jgi:hypothetical protein
MAPAAFAFVTLLSAGAAAQAPQIAISSQSTYGILHNPSDTAQPLPYSILLGGANFTAATTASFTWSTGSAAGTVHYISATSLVVTIPASISPTATTATITLCNVSPNCASTTLSLPDQYQTATATLGATASPATAGVPTSLSAKYSGSVGGSGTTGVPSGTVTFTSTANSTTTTLGTGKLTGDVSDTLVYNSGSTASAAPAVPAGAADFNGDGIPDLYYFDRNLEPKIHLFLSNNRGSSGGETTLQVTAPCTTVTSLVTGDLNKDGFADLVFTCVSTGGSVLAYAVLGNGDGSFQAPVSVGTVYGSQLALADVNKDGILDVVSYGSLSPSTCTTLCSSGFGVFKGNGDGTFSAFGQIPTSGSIGSSFLATDIDKDGYTDLVVLNNASQTTNSIDIYRNVNATAFGVKKDNGTYSPTYSIALQSYPTTYANLFMGDFNGDGLPDLGAVATPSGPAVITAALNGSTAGNVSFGIPGTLTLASGVTDIQTGDLNGDGFADLIVTSAGNGAFYESDGKGNFANTYTGFAVYGTTLDLVAADVNGDGYADVLQIASYGGAANLSYSFTEYVTTGPADATLSTTFATSGTQSLQATWPGDHDYLGSSGKLMLTVNPAATSTKLGSTLSQTQFGQAVTFNAGVTSSAATVTGNVAFVDNQTQTTLATVGLLNGAASFTTSTLTAGQHSIVANYLGTPTFGASPSAAIGVTVSRAQPVVTWNPTPSAIAYGTSIVAGELDATVTSTFVANVPGSFNYSVQPGAILAAGTQTLNVTFTPTDAVDFNAATGMASISVGKATPTVTWGAPAAVVIGTPLSATQLNATASGTLGNVQGSFVYNPASGAVLPAGTNQALTVTFNPTDTADYNIATGATTITVIPLAVAAVAPASVTIGASATPVTVNGTGFLSNSVVSINGTAVATTYNSPTSLSFTVPVSYLLTAQVLQITVSDPAQSQTSPAATFTVVAPVAAATFTGPSTVQAAQQPTLSFALTAQYPVAITGTVTLTFTSSTGVDDPAIQFASGGTTLTFTIPANSTTTPTIQLQSGTVTGTITCTLVLSAGGQAITPANIQPINITVPPAAPTVTSFTLTRSGNSITANLIGFSNTRELSQAVFHFSAANGSTINTPEITVPATAIFASWFTNTASQAYGSSFLYTQPFSLSSDQSAVGTVSVTLTNSAGISTTYTAQ